MEVCGPLSKDVHAKSGSQAQNVRRRDESGGLHPGEGQALLLKYAWRAYNISGFRAAVMTPEFVQYGAWWRVLWFVSSVYTVAKDLDQGLGERESKGRRFSPTYRCPTCVLADWISFAWVPRPGRPICLARGSYGYS